MPNVRFIVDFRGRRHGFSGNFQEEVVGVPEAVGHAFDDLDAVVDAFEHAGVQRGAIVNSGVRRD